jgi:hypothetical protein
VKRAAGRTRRRAPHAAGTAAFDVPRVAYLYADPSSPTLRLRDVAASLRKTLGVRCVIRDEFLGRFGGPDLEALASRIAATKVRNLTRRFEDAEPLFGEVQFELRLLRDPAKRVPGVLYDGFRYAELLRDLLPPAERSLRILHIVFGHRLLGTFDEDGRYHARAVIGSYPSAVSTSGIVEGPAKPEDYYKVKARLSMALGAVPFEAAKAPFEGRFIDYDDARLTEVAKGYALQASMYHVTKEPFCPTPSCRLFNAHWQAEVIVSQIESGELCEAHAATAAAVRRLASRVRSRGGGASTSS